MPFMDARAVSDFERQQMDMMLHKNGSDNRNGSQLSRAGEQIIQQSPFRVESGIKRSEYESP